MRLLLGIVEIFGKLSQFHGFVQGMLLGMGVLARTLTLMHVIRRLSLQILLIREPAFFQQLREAAAEAIVDNDASSHSAAEEAPDSAYNIRLQKRELDEAHRRSPLVGFLAKLAKVIANLSYKNTDACDFFLTEPDLLLFLLRQTMTDFAHPTLREYSLFAIRNLCQESPEIRSAINRSNPSNFDQETADFLKRIGIAIRRLA